MLTQFNTLEEELTTLRHNHIELQRELTYCTLIRATEITTLLAYIKTRSTNIKKELT
jgi:hypothetical protein